MKGAIRGVHKELLILVADVVLKWDIRYCRKRSYRLRASSHGATAAVGVGFFFSHLVFVVTLLFSDMEASYHFTLQKELF